MSTLFSPSDFGWVLGRVFPPEIWWKSTLKKGPCPKEFHRTSHQFSGDMLLFPGSKSIFMAYANSTKGNAAKELVAKPSPYLPTYICTVLSAWDGDTTDGSCDPNDVRIYVCRVGSCWWKPILVHCVQSFKPKFSPWRCQRKTPLLGRVNRRSMNLGYMESHKHRNLTVLLAEITSSRML